MGLDITPIRITKDSMMTAGSADSISSKVSISLTDGTDQSISITPTNYSITQIQFSAPTTNLSTTLITGSVYTGTAKSGTQLVSVLPLTNLTGSGTYANASLTAAAQNTIFSAGTLYVNLDNVLASGTDTVNVQIFGGTF